MSSAARWTMNGSCRAPRSQTTWHPTLPLCWSPAVGGTHERETDGDRIGARERRTADARSIRRGQRRQASDNREEIDRARRALTEAAQGASVAVVSGGDPGVFAMAAAICEALERGPGAWLTLDIAIVPGVTSMLAVAARVGAPLGHDFCALSLSDNLKPWPVVEQRLRAAASAGFAIALYNPISRSRP